MSDHDKRDPTDELLERARDVLGRRRATLRHLEERHTRRREARGRVGEDQTSGDEPADVSAVFRQRLEERAARRGEVGRRLHDGVDPDDAA